jgi:peptidoglycan/LPS O-acetylase OafA/YrhL
LDSLDWLRGLLALSIMIYHLVGWTLYQPDAGELLGRLGIYGVSMFFILSGLAIASSCADGMADARAVLVFFVRRVFRIWPLLWLAVIVVMLGDVLLKGSSVNWSLFFLNITAAFGFVDPGAYVNTGAWSIGNEVVYYAMTPVILVAFNRGRSFGVGVILLAACLAAVFAFVELSPAATLATQWQVYINPFNNLFLYSAGVAIYYGASQRALNPVTCLLLLLVGGAVFAFFPAHGDLVVLVTGINRLIFCVASMLVVLSFYKLDVRLPGWMSSCLTTLGAATYGVYLLHPIVFSVIKLLAQRGGISLGPVQMIVFTMAVTILVAVFLYENFERPLIRLGKRLTQLPSVGLKGARR